VNKYVLKYLILLSFVSCFTKLFAFEKDTAKQAKVPKHYFNSTIYLDNYGTGVRNLDTINKISKRLKSYNIAQFNIGFNVPLFTKDFYKSDGTQISNFHFLLTGAHTRIDLEFGGISKHQLVRNSLGFRGIYNNGKRVILFGEVSPFSTIDRVDRNTKTSRLAFSFIYNFTPNDKFSLRIGFTRTFLWGNRYNIPYVGIRVGRLDKFHVSIQFPRSFNINIPMGKYVRTSIFAKPQGGLFAFANTDSIKIGDLNNNYKLFFGRYEFLSGLRVDVLPAKWFNFYLSTGFTTSNSIALTAPRTAPNNLSPYKNYYRQNIDPSIFLNFGIVFRLGKTKSVYNNYQMYDAMDMNNNIDAGHNASDVGNGNIPMVPGAKPKIKNSNSEILDLLETQDLY